MLFEAAPLGLVTPDARLNYPSRFQRARSHPARVRQTNSERAMLAYTAQWHRRESDRAAPIRARGYRETSAELLRRTIGGVADGAFNRHANPWRSKFEGRLAAHLRRAETTSMASVPNRMREKGDGQ